MINALHIFKIRREERWPALAALLYVVAWNVVMVCSFSPDFFQQSSNYRKVFLHFGVSGFDPISYIVISQWGTGYNIYRHPLLAFFMWVPSQINRGLMALTGINFAVVLMAVILVACAFYSFILLKRIFSDVLGLKALDSWLLSWLTFSFAYVMVGMSVPDHFCLSMLMLTLTLYVAGRKMKARHAFTRWQTVLLFFITAGISLNNGIKVLLANLFVNGRRFWRPANLLLVVVIPSLLIWLGARLEWKHFERPRYVARQQAKAKKDSVWRARTFIAFTDTTSLKDPAEIRKAYNQLISRKIHEKYRRDHRQAWNLHKGKPINKSEFGQWTDVSTPRWASLVENVFGESMQLHQDYLLKDVLVSRPVTVSYRHVWNYGVEAIVALLFIMGILCGHRQRFLWLALSFFGFDMLIHFVLGFGLNEVYIMSPHWLFIITIAIGYLFTIRWNRSIMAGLRLLVALLALYLMAWNGVLYAGYLL